MPLLVRLFILRRDKFKTLQIYGFFGLCKGKSEKICKKKPPYWAAVGFCVSDSSVCGGEESGACTSFSCIFFTPPLPMVNVYSWLDMMKKNIIAASASIKKSDPNALCHTPCINVLGLMSSISRLICNSFSLFSVSILLDASSNVFCMKSCNIPVAWMR